MKIVCIGLASMVALSGCVRAVQIPTRKQRDQAHCALEVDPTCASKDAASQSAQQAMVGTIAAGKAVPADNNARHSTMAAAYGGLNNPSWWHIDYRNASAFCANIVEYGDKAAVERRAWGWPLALLGAAGTAALTGYAGAEADNGKEAAALGVAAAASVVVSIVGAALINRGNAAAKAVFAAQTAKRSFPDNDNTEDLWEKCFEIRTDWAGDDASSAGAP